VIFDDATPILGGAIRCLDAHDMGAYLELRGMNGKKQAVFRRAGM